MRKIVIASGNQGKTREILSALHPLQGFEVLTISDIGGALDIEETGKTHAENALIKAKTYFAKTGIPTIAEDSGMEVEALEGELGVNTRRWGAGEKAKDQEWLSHFMNRMVSEKNRNARFVCHAVYIDKHGYQGFEGECQGMITGGIEGPMLPGIPLSAVFKPIGHRQVYSAMTEAEKNKLSHRGKAIKALKAWLLKQKRIVIFIDVGNVWNVYKSIGKLLDFAVFKKFFSKQFFGTVSRVGYYVAYPKEGTRSKETLDRFHKYLTYLKKQLGFEVIKKPLKTIYLKNKEGKPILDSTTGFPQSIEKGNFDVEITLDALKSIQNYDIAIFLTGDSDFLPLISFLRNAGKKVYIFSTQGCISHELRTGGDGYFDLAKFPEIHGKWLKSKKTKK